LPRQMARDYPAAVTPHGGPDRRNEPGEARRFGIEPNRQSDLESNSVTQTSA
jgi:hypothetical protein